MPTARLDMQVLRRRSGGITYGGSPALKVDLAPAGGRWVADEPTPKYHLPVVGYGPVEGPAPQATT